MAGFAAFRGQQEPASGSVLGADRDVADYAGLIGRGARGFVAALSGNCFRRVGLGDRCEVLPIVDPLGASLFFLSLTGEYAPEARKALSWRIAMNSFALLVASYFVGTYILAFFGISLPVVQFGGGLIVVATGWRLLSETDDEKHDVHRTVQPQDTFRHAFYPLTMPLTVGPGSISVAVTLGANAAHSHALHPLTIVAALGGLGLIALSIFFCYGFSVRLGRFLGATAMTVNIQMSSFF